MGLKRPFDAEEMQECNAKHSRQLSYSPHQLDDKTSVLEDLNGLFDKKKATWTQDAPSPSPLQDVDTPRKLIPVGSNHQADIPEYVGNQTGTYSESEEKCITPTPRTGQGRKECICMDKSSSRCVRQHIVEAREKLTEAIGYKRFRELGLCEMGEEVASLWTEDEQDLFHQVVYSNPVSLGRDFWKELKWTFPSRNIKELVSYYFNVFILRRRAIQNRFETLDIDSDDDDWQVEYSGKSLDEKSYEEEEEEEDSPIEEVNVEDNSCTSFESQDSNLILPTGNRECPRSGDDSHSFDGWNKKNDLQPTSNIIEDIFGQLDWGK